MNVNLTIARTDGTILDQRDSVTATEAKQAALKALDAFSDRAESLVVNAVAADISGWRGWRKGESLHKVVPTWNQIPGQGLVIDIAPDIDPVGATEIAERLGVRRQTVEVWQQRHTDFPASDWTVGGRPAWRWMRVHEWAKRTGRL